VDVVMGDARLMLAERVRSGPPDKFALLVIDAFSSDAIPVHLLTEEAMDIYLPNLAEDGLLAIHISNRYLDLEPVLGNLAEKRGLSGFIQIDGVSNFVGKAASSWVILAPPGRSANLDRLPHEERWPQWQSEHGWTEGREAMLRLSALPDAGSGLHA